MVIKSPRTNNLFRPGARRSGPQRTADILALNVGLWLAVLYLSISPGYVSPGGKEWAWRVVERSIQAEGTVAYEGLREIVMFRNGQKVAGYQQKVQHAPDNRERIVVLHPPEQRGRLEVSDGHSRWMYYPATKRVVVSSVPPLRKLHQTRLGSLRGCKRQLQAEYLGDETVAGRVAYILRITDGQRQPLRQLWIDQHTFVQLKVQRFTPNGQIIYSAYFTTINYNPTFASDLFTFQPPADCHLARVPPPLQRMSLAAAERQAGFRAILPRYIPKGYQLERDSVAVTRHQGHFMLWLPFSNGLDTFSMFQGPRRLQPPPKVAGASQWWLADKYCFALVGPLPPEEIQKIKASMHR